MRNSGEHRFAWWIVVVVVAVMTMSAVYVGKLRLSEIPDPAIGRSPGKSEAGVVRDKSIEYVVTAASGSSVRVSYLQPGGRVVDAEVRAPWRKVVRTREISTSAGVLTQGSGGDAVECTVRVNGFVRAHQRGSGTGRSSVANCVVPAA